MQTAWMLARGLLLGAMVGAPDAQKPALVPLDDREVVVPILPAGISRNQPELFGRYVHIWSLPDGIQAVQYYGDFLLQFGERRLRSRDAVIWMQKSIWERTVFYHFEVFLSNEAQVRDSAGTLTTAPMLFVTFNSDKPAVIEADVHTGASAADSKLYGEASRIRQEVLAARVETRPGEMRVLEPRQAPAPRPRSRPIVRHRAKDEVLDEANRTITATGHVYLAQGSVDAADFLEIKADAAVLFLAEREREKRPETAPAGQEPFPTGVQERVPSQRQRPEGQDLGAGLSAAVSGAYLRGDVVLTRGERMIRASEIYYDFENDRALILDAVMRALAPERNVPIYVRAQEVRQLSATEYYAGKAMVSTSEFHTPHIHIGAERLYLTDITPRDQAGQITGLNAGKYRMYDVTGNIEGVPLTYWPYAEGDFRETESPVRSVRMAYSDDFGATFQSKWYLFNLLGMEKPKGIDALMRLDYFSERGPGAGLDVDYETENSYGLFRGYYIHDTGTDNLGPYRDGTPETENRGRFTLRHRELLPKGWELTLEFSYLSDPNFLEEYFNAEFEQGKEQETLLYLKKQEDNWAFTALAQWRILDFLTQTEHLPDLGFNWIGEPIGEFASYYNDTRLGFVRYKPDNRRIYDYGSDITFRTDSRNEIDFPLKLGTVNLVPFAMGRGGYWDSSPEDGSTDRMFGNAGLRSGTQFWRVFEETKSKLLDVNGVRHIIRPEATAWASASNRTFSDLWPFDRGVESIDDFYGTSLAMRQQWQTKRGGPGQWRSVDWITFDVELNLFGNVPRYGPFFNSFQTNGPTGEIGRFYDSRPEDSIARNHVRTDFRYRISDTTAVLSEGNWDINDGSMDLLNLSYAVERTPRFSYFVGYRRIGDTNSNLVGGGTNYELNTKHRLALRTYYDLDRGEVEELDLAIIRRFPRWYAALTFGLDNIEEDVQVGVSVWPEGAPNAVVGSRRFTGVAESTGIRPQD